MNLPHLFSPTKLGALELANSPSGGLMAVIRLQQATESRQGSLLKKRR